MDSTTGTATNGRVIVVDDAESDRFFLTRAFGKIAPDITLECHEDVAEAIAGLDRDRRPAPTIMIVDVNMPGEDGLTMLAWARTHHPTLPVVMLSGSASPADRTEAYRLGAAGFFTKPMGVEKLESIVRSIVDYWFRNARLAEQDADS